VSKYWRNVPNTALQSTLAAREVCKAIGRVRGGGRTSIITAVKPAGFHSAHCLAVQLDVICHCSFLACRKGRQPGLAKYCLPAPTVPSREGPHIGPTLRVVVAEAIRRILVSTARPRVRDVPEHKSCSRRPCHQIVSHAFISSAHELGHTVHKCTRSEMLGVACRTAIGVL
jgi:hypothetical protein